MTLRGWMWLVRREIAAQPGRALLLVLCAALACGVCGIALHGLRYVRAELRPHIESLFPEERLVVRPGEVDVAFFRMKTKGIDDAALETMRAMEGVARVAPQMTATFPVTAEISIGRLGFDFTTDVVIFGVPAELIARDLPANVAFAHDAAGERPVPVAVSAYFLDMYNLGLAEGSNLPKMSAAAAIGREFDLVLGESSLGLASRGEPRRVRARIVGLVRDPLLTGLVVPLETMRAWNAEFTEGAPSYGLVHLDVADADASKAVAARLAEMGLRTEASADTLARFAGIATGVELALAAFMAIVLALAATAMLSVAAMAARERRAVWGLQRAAGLPRGILLSLVAGEGAILAVPASLLACALAGAAIVGARAVAGPLVDSLAILPASPLRIDALAMAGTVLLCAMLVAAPLVLFAMPALRREPADLLALRAV